MAKKTVATLSKGGAKDFTKVIKMRKTENGSYSFTEQLVGKDSVKDFLAK